MPKMESYADRFWGKVEDGDPSECWPWLGPLNREGYGSFTVTVSFKRKTTLRPHRIAYELSAGEIPDGWEIDHLCSNPWCMNPAHLEAVEPRENIRRAIERRHEGRTHCNYGHEYDEANTYWRRGRMSLIPTCRKCGTRRALEYKQRKRLA